MFDKHQLIRIRPLLVFLVCYTAGFLLFAATLKYTFPFLAGFLLALLAQPLIECLRRRLHFHQTAAAAVATLAVYAVLFGLLFLIGLWLIREISNLIAYISTLKPSDLGPLTSPFSSLIQQFNDAINHFDAGFLQQNQEKMLNLAQTGLSLATKTLSAVLGFLTSLPAIFTMFIVMIFSTYFFSKDMRKIKNSLLGLFTAGGADDLRNYSRNGRSLSGKYIGSYLLIYFITFVETLIVFIVLGVPYPLVFSLITGIADILPVLGPGTIYIPISCFYLFTGNYFTAGALLVCWLIITAIRQIIEPKIVSSSIDIHPLSMLAAIYFALVAKNFWILIYIPLLMILYQTLTKSGKLPTLFEHRESSSGAKQPPLDSRTKP
ncbi:sporulation integral membrane protein YtvI [Caproiciproducens sp. NJN-50]|uniref:sporulation integral membrane protein YtvI n=1 Tax=Acutalibacteraceae TaxID=3082771 RepID=UPI000FFDFE07|nr:MULTISPECIES: sporulation integral membrane protein YtvI [Acutalibacteraceae]QAT48482.1 sporulation integral membrane protein YtvI [Caproiciproducens sp. NJN-50]